MSDQLPGYTAPLTRFQILQLTQNALDTLRGHITPEGGAPDALRSFNLMRDVLEEQRDPKEPATVRLLSLALNVRALSSTAARPEWRDVIRYLMGYTIAAGVPERDVLRTYNADRLLLDAQGGVRLAGEPLLEKDPRDPKVLRLHGDVRVTLPPTEGP